MRLKYIILALSSVIVAIETAHWSSHVMDFIPLVPQDKIAAIGARYMFTDSKFGKAYKYLQSSNFEALVRNEIIKSPEVLRLLSYFEVVEKAVPGLVIKFLQYIPGYTGGDRNTINSATKYAKADILNPFFFFGIKKGMTGFIEEAAKTLPDKKIAGLIKQKLPDPVFAKWYAKLIDPKHKTLVNTARNAPSMANAIKTLSQNNIFVDPIIKIVFEKLDLWNKMVSRFNK